MGIPDHAGVYNVGGRVGAANGPTAFRNALTRFKHIRPHLIFDRDVSPIQADVALNHTAAARLVAEAHSLAHLQGGRSVIVGGGHDHGYSHLRGVAQALTEDGRVPRIGCINIDAHLDVRPPVPVITSGSPFYLALESQTLRPDDFVEFGIQRHCNGQELWDYVNAKGVKVVPFRELRNGQAVHAFERELQLLATSCDAIVISLDLDAIACAFAPGVSAPQAEGFTPSDVAEMMEVAGRHAKVASLGIFELNPEHDSAGATALLAASSCFHFISHSIGVAI